MFPSLYVHYWHGHKSKDTDVWNLKQYICKLIIGYVRKFATTYQCMEPSTIHMQIDNWVNVQLRTNVWNYQLNNTYA